VTYLLQQRPISTDVCSYCLSRIKANEKYSVITSNDSTTSFPTSYWWITYVTPKSPKCGSETLLRCFTNKIVTLSIKFCYAVEVPTLNYWSHVFMTTALCTCIRVCGIVSKSLILINKTYLCVVNLHSKHWWPFRCFSPCPCLCFRTSSPWQQHWQQWT